MLPSRLVTYLDELEERGVLERCDNPDDRRLYALRLTDRGARTMADIGRIAKMHDQAICAALGEAEREQLGALLERVADAEGLTPGVHPGFAGLLPRPGGLPPGGQPGENAHAAAPKRTRKRGRP